MVASNARKIFGFLHISFYKVVQIVLPIILSKRKTTYTPLLYNSKEQNIVQAGQIRVIFF